MPGWGEGDWNNTGWGDSGWGDYLNEPSTLTPSMERHPIGKLVSTMWDEEQGVIAAPRKTSNVYDETVGRILPSKHPGNDYWE